MQLRRITLLSQQLMFAQVGMRRVWKHDTGACCKEVVGLVVFPLMVTQSCWLLIKEENLKEPSSRRAKSTFIDTRDAGTRAPWQHGLAERRGGIFGYALQYIL
jgi:hypothetical protein